MNSRDQLLRTTLAEAEALLQTVPTLQDCQKKPELVDDWVARGCACIEHWDIAKSQAFRNACYGLTGRFEDADTVTSIRAAKRLLLQAKYSLRSQLYEPVSMGLDAGATYEYFEAIRKEVEKAALEVFFVDAYLDAEFVSRFLPHVQPGVRIRLLTKRKLAQLVPALQAFIGQHGHSIEVRETQQLHDRFLFVDQRLCFLSGASFKDAAKASPATFTEIRDSFQVHLQLYESLWTSASTVQL